MNLPPIGRRLASGWLDVAKNPPSFGRDIFEIVRKDREAMAKFQLVECVRCGATKLAGDDCRRCGPKWESRGHSCPDRGRQHDDT